jgi:hypothetical protein
MTPDKGPQLDMDPDNEFLIRDQVSGIYEFEVALNLLLECSIRRRSTGPS